MEWSWIPVRDLINFFWVIKQVSESLNKPVFFGREEKLLPQHQFFHLSCWAACRSENSSKPTLHMSSWKSNVALMVKEHLKTKPKQEIKWEARRCHSSLTAFLVFSAPLSLLSPGQLNSEPNAVQGRLWRWHVCKCSDAACRYKGRITLGKPFQ